MSALALAQLLQDAAACPTPLAMALDALDLHLAREVRRVRTRGATPLDELRGLYVSDERVDRVLGAPRDFTACEDEPGAISDHMLVHPEWRGLAAQLAPSALERDLVLLALVRDVRLDYELVFGFLNDDLTRRWPTRDLAIRLLARDEGDVAVLRDAMAERSPLVIAGVLAVVDTGDRSSWLAAGIGTTPLATALLTGANAPEHRLPPGVVVLRGAHPHYASSVHDAARSRLRRTVGGAWSGEELPAVILEGRDGSGRTALASELAAELECPLLRVDVHTARTADAGTTSNASTIENAVAAALLWQRLAGAVVLIDGADDWCTRDDGPRAPPRGIIDRLATAAGPVLLRMPPEARWHAALGALRTARIDMRVGSVDDRAAAWRDAVQRTSDRPLDDDESLILADRFDLAPGHIARVVRRAVDEGALDDARHSADVARRVAETARADSCDALAGLATRAPTPNGWHDLVLPAATMARLRDFANAVRDRAIVLDKWGFGRRTASSRGITALFAGASGTGKTMAAGVVARELGLDLFVIDLSTVVSKYIGETEKQLQKVFRAARDAGAILFFDEADALFGKRSEVKDAHDRYANVEVAYLLQQLDIHDSPVVLATNLARNLDAAFSRRMRYVLEFPIPAPADRLRLWHGIFPREAPLGEDVDLEFLASRFHLAGGDIRNVAIESAYLAAAEGGHPATIAMRHVIRAMARQVVKQGRPPSAAEFGAYVALIDGDV